MSNVAAGWYPDSNDSSQLRYWNGEEWTEHVHPVAQQSVPPSAAAFVQRSTGQRMVGDGDPSMGVPVPWYRRMRFLILGVFVGLLALVAVVASLANDPQPLGPVIALNPAGTSVDDPSGDTLEAVHADEGMHDLASASVFLEGAFVVVEVVFHESTFDSDSSHAAVEFVVDSPGCSQTDVVGYAFWLPPRSAAGDLAYAFRLLGDGTCEGTGPFEVFEAGEVSHTEDGFRLEVALTDIGGELPRGFTVSSQQFIDSHSTSAIVDSMP